MSDFTLRRLCAACGIAGVLLLTAHFVVPTGLPHDSAPVATLMHFARAHRTAILVSAWMQVTGAVLYVLFILAVIRLAGADDRFTGRAAGLAGAILIGLTLLDSALIIAAVKAADAGHAETLRVSYDLIAGPGNDGVGRVFLIAPAIMLAFGLALRGTGLVPRMYGNVALGFGAISQALGLIGLFSTVAFGDVNPAVLGLENLWLLAIAVAVARGRAPLARAG